MTFYKTIRFRIIILYLLIFSGILLGFSIILYGNFEQRLYSEINSNLASAAAEFAEAIDIFITTSGSKVSESRNNGSILEFIRRHFKAIYDNWATMEDLKMMDIIVQIFDGNGEYVVSSKEIHNFTSLSKEAFTKAREGLTHFDDRFIETKELASFPLRKLTLPIMDSGRELRYIIRVAKPISPVIYSLTILKIILMVLVPLTVAIAGFMGKIFSKISLNPVERMIQTLYLITAENLKLRINSPGTNDEFGKLADAFNGLLDRLENSFSAQKNLVEDLSHELKTPLSAMKGEIEIALKQPRSASDYKEILESNGEEIDKITKTIEKLLVFSRFESDYLSNELTKINLSIIVVDVLEDMKLLASQKKLELNENIASNIFIRADEIQIKNMLINMLDNSIKYTKEGSIDVTLAKDSPFALLQVADTGIGIPEDELPYIFDRYYRVIKSKFRADKGFGLGLNIVKHIVDLHKGQIEVRSSMNKGSTFMIKFPLLEN